MRPAGWNAERVELLKSLWAGGASAQAIAERLGGVSRSAVMGKIFRLRFEAPGSTPVSANAPRARRRRGKTLLQLTNQSCRWPHGEPGEPGFHFCGVPGADLERGMPYCPRHARLAYGSAATVRESNTAPAPDGDDLQSVSAPSLSPKRSDVWREPVRRPAARWR